MKFILYVLAFVLMTVKTMGQTCDIATNGVAAMPNSLVVGQTSNLVFRVFNFAGEPNPPPPTPCFYEINSVEVILDLPDDGLDFQQIVTPAGGLGVYFTWTYNPLTKEVRGLNHSRIYDLQGDIVTVRVIATALLFYPQLVEVKLEIFNFCGCPGFPSNNIGNDKGLTTLNVIGAGPTPVDLLYFNAENIKCNTMELTWETASEKNNDYFEVERSVNGRDFLTVGKVDGTNKPSGSSYTFLDDKNMVGIPNFYYRLKQVDFDGKFEHFDIIRVENSCENEGVSMSVYPNPAFDKVNISLNGLSENERVKLVITNVIGEVVMTIPNASASDVNEIKLNGLTAGIYNVKLVGFEETTSKRFIKVD